jgi:hypothetical protein
MGKITMAQLCAVCGTTEKVLHHWLERLKLSTRYAKAKTGPARNGRFTRENVVELALIARLVRVGLGPSIAAARVAELLDQWRSSLPKAWAIFFNEKDMRLEVLCLDEPPERETLAELAEEDFAFVMVNTAAVVAKVDAAFAEAEAEAETLQAL